MVNGTGFSGIEMLNVLVTVGLIIVGKLAVALHQHHT